VQSTGRGTVIFIPDEYLARNVARETGRDFVLDGEDRETGGNAPHPGGRIIGWSGRCEVHEKFAVEDIDNARMQFPGVLVLAHPECSPKVVGAADFSGSTSAMIRRVQSSSARHYLLLTECSMGDNIAAENPEKEMVRVCSVRCPHMNEITLEDTLAALEQDRYPVEVPQEIHAPARRSIERMLAVS
jgi:quinolinate synthase